jgi:hypothetical protein
MRKVFIMGQAAAIFDSVWCVAEWRKVMPSAPAMFSFIFAGELLACG